MQSITRSLGRWMAVLLVAAGFVQTADAQRTVTLTVNMATLPDTIGTSGLVEVRGQTQAGAPSTLADGNIIDWSDMSTLEPENIGGDYWRIQFQIADTTDLTFKFYSEQASSADNSIGNGWEADPNPTIPPGTGDTTLTTHFFEAQVQYKDFGNSDKGPYDWRPYEAKEDSVAIWFRVYMNTEAALGIVPAYDRSEASTQQIGVRGDPLGGVGQLSWDNTQVILTRERTDNNTSAGYDLFSGVAYYPASAAGTTQPYKFVIQDGSAVGWETSSDRSFVIPANDSTLYWQYFSNSPAAQGERATSTIIAAVDLTPLRAVGIYDAGRGDTLQVRGAFNAWGCENPTICLLQDVPGEDVFEIAVPLTQFPGFEYEYKYFIDFNNAEFLAAFGKRPVLGWEEPISTTGANRSFVFSGASDEQDLGVQFFNDILPPNIIDEDVSIDVTWQVRMDSALTNLAAPFVPGTDSVTIFLGDPIWAFTQDLPSLTIFDNTTQDSVSSFPATMMLQALVLTDEDQDGLYTGTMTVNGPTFSGIQYQYSYGTSATMTTEAGGSTSGLGRRRTRFIEPNSDGSWPTEWTFPEETFLVTGLLPFETNPATSVAIERANDELPTRIALEANYPNPFNPVTTIEYSVAATEHVKLQVFDLTGRLVATLVDSVQPAANYRVGFDAQDLASGMYLYRLQAAGTTLTRKMVLLK